MLLILAVHTCANQTNDDSDDCAREASSNSNEINPPSIIHPFFPISLDSGKITKPWDQPSCFSVFAEAGSYILKSGTPSSLTTAWMKNTSRTIYLPKKVQKSYLSFSLWNFVSLSSFPRCCTFPMLMMKMMEAAAAASAVRPPQTFSSLPFAAAQPFSSDEGSQRLKK